MERSGEEEDTVDAERSFRLSSSDLAIFKRLASNLRNKLVKAEPSFIRSAAPAILALERLPRPTGGVQVRFGCKTPNQRGNYGWADISLSEDDIKGTVGKHFYDPEVGGDTESSVLFHRQVGGSSDYGSLEDWWEQAEGLSAVGYLSAEDDSDWDAIDWCAE